MGSVPAKELPADSILPVYRELVRDYESTKSSNLSDAEQLKNLKATFSRTAKTTPPSECSLPRLSDEPAVPMPPAAALPPAAEAGKTSTPATSDRAHPAAVGKSGSKTGSYRLRPPPRVLLTEPNVEPAVPSSDFFPRRGTAPER
jgi:hypothetical protein